MADNIGFITETSLNTGEIIGFIIWTVVALLFVFIGFYAWNSDKPVGFFTGQKPPEVSDVKGYNHAVAKIWFVFAAAMELLGLPLLAGQNSPYIMLSVIGAMFSVIGIAVAYVRVEAKYKK